VKSTSVAIECIGNDLWVVCLTGEHDITTAPYVRRQLDAVPPEVAAIVIDLSDTTFIDSGMLAELIQARRGMESIPGRSLAVVVPPGGAAAGLFDLVDADRRFFQTFDSCASALGALGNASGLGE
jgi:anti-anti-sigma regulatory factor